MILKINQLEKRNWNKKIRCHQQCAKGLDKNITKKIFLENKNFKALHHQNSYVNITSHFEKQILTNFNYRSAFKSILRCKIFIQYFWLLFFSVINVL